MEKKLYRGVFRFVFHLNQKSCTILYMQNIWSKKTILAVANKLERERLAHQIIALNNNTILSVYNTINNTSLSFVLSPYNHNLHMIRENEQLFICSAREDLKHLERQTARFHFPYIITSQDLPVMYEFLRCLPTHSKRPIK